MVLASHTPPPHNSGNAGKKTFFFQLTPSLSRKPMTSPPPLFSSIPRQEEALAKLCCG